MNINDVAKAAGVSRGSVSNYLNNKNVSDQMKSKIETAIKELNYVPNSSARDLRSKESKFVVFIIPSLSIECNVTETLPVTESNGQVTQQIKNKNQKENKNVLDNSSRETEDQSTTYLKPEYYSLLQVIADRYNDRFIYPYNYTLTHKQKMAIGQFLSEGYMTSDEVLGMIDRIPNDVESPLAYLMSSMERLKDERLLEAKVIAHENARKFYQKG